MSEGTIAQVLAGEAQWCVVQGDCLNVLASMPDKCGVVVTDPIYGAGKKIVGDSMPWEEWLPYLDARLTEHVRVGRLVFATFIRTRLVRFIRETTVPPQQVLHWHKPMMLHDTSLNGSPFLAHGEVIFYWGPNSPKEAGKLGYDSFAVNAMWPSERRAMGIEHPTPKPPLLWQLTIPRWSREDEIIIDPWCGSGSTLVSALRCGRRCIGIDIDARWVEASRKWLRTEEAGGVLPSVSGQGALAFGGQQ